MEAMKEIIIRAEEEEVVVLATTHFQVMLLLVVLVLEECYRLKHNNTVQHQTGHILRHINIRGVVM
jgi:chaperonin cofactor prefoldin